MNQKIASPTATKKSESNLTDRTEQYRIERIWTVPNRLKISELQFEWLKYKIVKIEMSHQIGISIALYSTI